MSIGELIKTARENAGLTQVELGEKIGVTGVAIMRYEKGQRQPRLEQLQAIASVLGVSVDYLLGTEKEKVPAQEDERQKKLDQIYKFADSTYDFFLKLCALVGSDKQLPRDILFKTDETEQVKREIEELLVKFMESATTEEKANFVLQLHKIGQEFEQQVDSLEGFNSKYTQKALQSTPPVSESTGTAMLTSTPERPPKGE